MIATIALAGTLAASLDGPGYRIAVFGEPGSTVTIGARVPRGWLAAFCSARICKSGHVEIVIPHGGKTAVEVHFYNVKGGPHGTADVSAGRNTIALSV